MPYEKTHDTQENEISEAPETVRETFINAGTDDLDNPIGEKDKDYLSDPRYIRELMDAVEGIHSSSGYSVILELGDGTVRQISCGLEEMGMQYKQGKLQGFYTQRTRRKSTRKKIRETQS